MILTLVLADQLFEAHPAFTTLTDFVMLESKAECGRLPYHKFKLAYLLTCMREYADYLTRQNRKLYYFDLERDLEFEQALSGLKLKHGYTVLQVCQVNNKYFQRYLEKTAAKLGLDLVWLSNPMFLTSSSEFKTYLRNKPQKRNLMGDFYIWQRKRLKILVDENNQPIGQTWSFDQQNRQKLPAKTTLPENNLEYSSSHFQKVKQLVQKYFASHPGQLPENSWLPINHAQAENHLKRFLEDRLAFFGDYEDALSDRDFLLFHSALSSSLNYGLLTPAQVLDKLNEHTGGLIFGGGKFENNQKLNSLEGFVRQVIGWREWVKGMYDNFYDEKFLDHNFFQNQENLPRWFFDYNLPPAAQANTPLKLVLEKVDKYAYCHHIERLMVLSNWMTLNEYHPKQCYEWFASQFVDAFEWVMVPNVMGMGLFADGGIYATKPYISGGNYLRKMSDYRDFKIWEPVWTEKFWSFITKHREFFENQPRLGLLLKQRDKASPKS
jgi:deoxyribodipyrimidine photolyase-related protein